MAFIRTDKKDKKETFHTMDENSEGPQEEGKLPIPEPPKSLDSPAPDQTFSEHERARGVVDDVHDELRKIEDEIATIESKLVNVEKAEADIEKTLEKEREETEAKLRNLEDKVEETKSVLSGRMDNEIKKYLEGLDASLNEAKKASEEAYGKLEERLKTELTEIKETITKEEFLIANVSESKKAEERTQPVLKISAESFLANPVRFVGKNLEVLDCEVKPRKQGFGGWWHVITDGTMELDAFSKKRSEGEGTIVGIVKMKDGKLYIEF